MIVSRSYAWFRSLRWNRSQFGAVLWWTCSPIGQLVIVDEFRFQQMGPAEVAAEIRRKDAELGMRLADNSENLPRYTAAEPKLWDVDRGPTVAELFARAGCPLTKSSADRVQGWNVLSSAMQQTVSDPQRPGVALPLLVVAENCTQLRRLIPLLREGQGTGQQAKEDIDTKTESALVEALRIGIMSRPSATEVEALTPKVGTMGHALQQARDDSERDGAQDYFG